ncbi:MAG: nucleotide exchange factor GrpE [Chloroflexi bacterium]|nr:nucleotide exchange factor GrpE [Chloroflexota bacterium]
MVPDEATQEGVPTTERDETANKEAIPSGAGADEVTALKRALEEERDRAEKYLANWQRAQADFLNLKRRTEQERSDILRFANATLILNLLPIRDDLERALDAVSTAMAGFTWLEGVRLIHRKLQALLEAQGVTQVKAEGELFDPNLHEAVMFEEGEEGKVIEELQKGYKLHDRVIRPAMVKVGRGKGEAAERERDSASG